MSDVKEKRYEPPRIVDLDLDPYQAAGQTTCVPGTFASGSCSQGSGPRPQPQCQTGGSAQNQCRIGFTAGQNCQIGFRASRCWLGFSQGGF